MRIMFCCGSLDKGGAQRVISVLSNQMIKNNNVSIMTTVKRKNTYPLDDKINIYTLDKTEKNSNHFILKNIFRIRRLINIIKEYNPDIIISFLPEPSFRVLFVNLFLRKKIIISVRNDPKIEYRNIFKKILVKILYERADGFVFQTYDAKDYFSKKIQNKSIIIPNPINSEFICVPYSGKREKVIVSVGRLEEQKNHKMLLDAFAKIIVNNPDYILKIYGEGKLKEELYSYSKTLKIDKKVKFMGICDNIKDEIYKASIYVLSSNYEGMPNSLMEAMSLGIPCISTDCPCGGPRMLIDNGKNGILIDVGDTNKLIDAIDNLIKNEKYALRLGKNANNISKKYNISTVSNLWEKYIKEIVKVRI